METRPWLLRLIAILTTTTALLLHPSTSSSVSTAHDLPALLSFKSLITKDPLGALSSWTTNGSTHGFCSWTGVECSSAHPGHVKALRLQGLGLSGTISPFLGNLSRLRALDLSGNKLQGQIPSSIGNCFALRTLNLSVNSLSGAIPPAMGNLSKLLVLSVSKNDISGTIPTSFAGLATVAVFSVARNHVHGQVPPWLGNLTALEDLNMADNIMSGHVPPALSKLINLRSLTVAINNLQGLIPPVLFNMSSLECLNFGSNQLSGSLPQDIGSMLPNLKKFSVFYNRFEGQIPASLSNISSLEHLSLHGNRFRGRIPSNIGQSGRLTVFEVGNNELQATESRDWDFLTSLANCSSLLLVNLQLNNLSGILPNSIGNLSQKLEGLRVGGNQIAGLIPTGIGRYLKLAILEFADNRFTGTIPSDIGKLSNLKELSLFQNRYYGEIPSSIGNLSQLNLLALSTNNLEGSIPATFGNLTELISLDLASNLLSGKIPEEVMRISSLALFLNLSNNLLDGPISPHIGQLANLAIIDFSSNKLSGPIPNALGSCIALQFLHLQGNLLQGQIPKELMALRGLEELDLSNNNLSGPVPEFLESFQLLKNLNLSFNHLSGPVPDKGIFSNASVISLTSNGMLCGGPVFFHFPTCPYPSPDKLASHKLLQILVFTAVGAFILLGVCIAARCYVNKSRGDAHQDQENIPEMFQRISYTELHSATDSFSEENLVGRGSFGSVYKGTSGSGANLITAAVKVLDVQRQGATRSFISECNALKMIRHRKLVKVITVCDSLDHSGNQFKALVLEFIPNGSLDKWLHPSTEDEFGTPNLMQRLNIALDVAEALEYLHDHIDPPIVHCDVKPSNILLDDDMVAHLGDFGLAKIIRAEKSKQSLADQSCSVGIKGTIGYVAPEYGTGTEISVEGDVYSYGVLLLEMLTGRRPTDPFFSDTTNLPKYVEMACPGNLLETMDVNIRCNQEPQAVLELFAAPVSRLGLACCRGSARQRIKMGDVVKELGAIKQIIMASQNYASWSTKLY
ncbi:putative receptor kinase [Hordeum vulgare]|uniref:Receptor kinase-like protein Xa21 n=2 Tax=Hordeum vulgare TaxID=4513 RepID=A0A8I7B1A0_HORVV|nr:probable LRR receptor-like serine/threonine-protein kinase At3g47570 [Hordeum vulgare subsp. vulgare]AAP31049.1 putative receptor kinase [Hordeum vulgare]KAE8800296.1 putative receptor kinase [Hordeum vulgare]